MADYDFSTLGSSDLENLTCDLLNADLPTGSPVKYKTFKDGKDKGIDILYASPENKYDHVGQVKHYYRTGFNGLLSHLKATEVAKVKLLKPNRYIIATSVDLTVAQSELIETTFQPFLQNTHDIYGKKDLNRLLAAHPNVLTRHYKLWFSDSAVLAKILESASFYRTADFVENELTRRIRLYAETAALHSALTSLNTNHFVIITGEPGVGKTTLAEMIVYRYLKDDFELLYVLDDVKEAEKFLRNDDSKQLIYFDDFLGSNGAEINKAQGSETALLSIIRRIRRHPNKRLIFTTRVHILNTVVDQSEKLKRSPIKEGKTLFHLHEYSQDIKAQLLLNHIDEAQIDPSYKDVLREEVVFQFIINHLAFNPRSVEYITLPENIKGYTPNAYRKFVFENFNNPLEIWEHAYRNQIGLGERLLLNTLLTFDEPMELTLLEKAFHMRVATDEKARHTLEINAFRTALQRLDKGFIVFQWGKINFINPSLKDFLLKYLKNDPTEVGLMLHSIKYIQQLSEPLLKMAGVQRVGLSIASRIDMRDNWMDYTRPDCFDQDAIRLAIFISRNFSIVEQGDVLFDIVESINDWEQLHADYQLSQDFLEFLKLNRSNHEIQRLLKVRTTEIVDDLFSSERDLTKAVERLKQLKDIFRLDFKSFNVDTIVRHLDDLFSEHISNEVDWLKDNITDFGEVVEKKDDIEYLLQRINGLGLRYEVEISDFDEDWFEFIMDNQFRRAMEKDD